MTGFNKAEAATSPYELFKHVKENGFTEIDNNSNLTEVWFEIGKKILSFFKFIIYIFENLTELSIILLNKIYEFLMLIALQTPLFIFNFSVLENATLTFSSISVATVIIFTMINGFKRKFKKQHTSLTKISRRWALAVIGSGIAPYAFYQSFSFLNKISQAIANIGSNEISVSEINGYVADAVHSSVLMLFDLILLALIIPLMLQNFRRWFDIMCLSSITPLALSAWVFDEHKHYFNSWWNNLKRLSMVQIIYAVFICAMGLFIFGTKNVANGWGVFFKLGIIIGGLYRMTNPPNIVKSKLDNGEDILETGKQMKNSYKNVMDTVTLRKFNPLYKTKNKIVGTIVNQFKK